MNKISILGLFMAFGLLFSFGCSSDDDGDLANVNCGANWLASEAVVNASSKYVDAFIAYNENPTQQNCNAFKEAANAYIDILESFRSCAVQQGSLEDWQESMDQTRSEFEDIC